MKASKEVVEFRDSLERGLPRLESPSWNVAVWFDTTELNFVAHCISQRRPLQLVRLQALVKEYCLVRHVTR